MRARTDTAQMHRGCAQRHWAHLLQQLTFKRSQLVPTQWPARWVPWRYARRHPPQARRRCQLASSAQTLESPNVVSVRARHRLPDEIVNVSAGVNPTDAVNVSQLEAIISNFNIQLEAIRRERQNIQ